MKALVLGATGFLGYNVVVRLVNDGHSPRCARRRRSNVLHLRPMRPEMVQCDLNDPQSVVEAMAGCTHVVHAAAHYPRNSLTPELSIALAIRQQQTVLDAAAEAGIERLVYLSSMATVAPPVHGSLATESDVFAAPPPHGPYHTLKWRMEQMALDEDRFETVVLCPGACIGLMDLRIGTSALLVAVANGMQPPHPDGVINLVDVQDVAAATSKALVHPNPPKRILLSGGNYGVATLMLRLARRYHAPAPAPALSAQDAIELADAEELDAAANGGRARLAREIADLIVHGVPVDTALAEKNLGMRWTPLDQTLDHFDGWARRLGIIPKNTTLENHP